MIATMHVPFVDLKAQHRQLAPEIEAAVHAVFERGDFILGAAVERFEVEYAALIGSRHARGHLPLVKQSEFQLDLPARSRGHTVLGAVRLWRPHGNGAAWAWPVRAKPTHRTQIAPRRTRLSTPVLIVPEFVITAVDVSQLQC